MDQNVAHAWNPNYLRSRGGISKSVFPIFQSAFITLETARIVSSYFRKQGVIHVFENRRNVTTSIVFLDIRDQLNSRGYEQGLLGLAFHPNYSANGYFYVDYTASSPLRTVIARYSVSQMCRIREILVAS